MVVGVSTFKMSHALHNCAPISAHVRSTNTFPPTPPPLQIFRTSRGSKDNVQVTNGRSRYSMIFLSSRLFSKIPNFRSRYYYFFHYPPSLPLFIRDVDRAESWMTRRHLKTECLREFVLSVHTGQQCVLLKQQYLQSAWKILCNSTPVFFSPSLVLFSRRIFLVLVFAFVSFFFFFFYLCAAASNYELQLLAS